MKTILLLISIVILCCPSVVHAGHLDATVLEVRDGKTMTVENIGRKISVAFEGADAPELDQPYGEIARQHLSDLVMNRQVTIVFTRMNQGESLIAQVFFNDMDIGRQMIRDGVAWYDRASEGEFSELDRRLYGESEQAARSERRGLWQDQSPTPPWEWRQARLAQANRHVEVDSKPAARIGETRRNISSSEHPEVENGKWPIFSPQGEQFSINIPRGGQAYWSELDMPDGVKLSANFYLVRHLKMEYGLIWAEGPFQRPSLSETFDRSFHNLKESLQRALEAKGITVSCDLSQEKDIPLSGFVGQKYNVKGCPFSGGIRLYYKVEGKRIKTYFVVATSVEPDNPLVLEFLKSFRIQKQVNGQATRK